MSTTVKHFLALIAAACLFGLTFSTALAQDDAGAAGKDGEAAAEETAGDGEAADDAAADDAAADEAGDAAAEDGAAEGPALSEEQMDYVAISSTVACYNKRVSDAGEAKKAIEAYLELEGITLSEYEALEKKFRGEADVSAAIKSEMDLCDTKVLAMPEADEPEEELTAEEKKELEEAEAKKEWTYRKKAYKGTASGGGVSGGRIIFAFQKNGKSAKGSLSGQLSGKHFALGLKGTRKGNKVTLKGNSGKKNSGSVTVTFKKATDKDGYEHYSKGSGKFSGKINGKNVSFSFTAKSKK